MARAGEIVCGGDAEQAGTEDDDVHEGLEAYGEPTELLTA
jgi:hypothetical protein